MTESDNYMLLSTASNIFGKDHLLANFLQDNSNKCQSFSAVIDTTFPSPASSATDSLFDSPETTSSNLSIDPTVLQNIPISVLQSLAAMYDHNNHVENFDQFVKFEDDSHALASGVVSSLSSPPLLLPPPPSSIVTTTAQKNLIATTTTTTTGKAKTYRPPRQLECHNCHVTKTPLWRRTPDRAHSLCNACGLYYKQYGTHRPLHVRQKQQSTKQQQQAVSVNHTPTTTTMHQSPIMSTTVVSPTITHVVSPPSVTTTSAAEIVATTNMLLQCSRCHQTNVASCQKNEQGELICHACDVSIQLEQKKTTPSSPTTTVKRGREEEDGNDDKTDPPNKKAHVVTTPPALFPAPPPAQSKEWTEIDDSRFKSLLSRMNTQQMHGFLDMLERRCAILRSILLPPQQE
ncbi:MAG: hypothetical protein EXX96DRAFT_564518 [Benjaminiella poitrasii]|nr:MAG: hypothetical protein EXX96DRAFT_564518 [Benjaminiella poitrasii]